MEEGLSRRSEEGMSRRSEEGMSRRLEEGMSRRSEEGMSRHKEKGMSRREEEGMSDRRREEEQFDASKASGLRGVGLSGKIGFMKRSLRVDDKHDYLKKLFHPKSSIDFELEELRHAMGLPRHHKDAEDDRENLSDIRTDKDMYKDDLHNPHHSLKDIEAIYDAMKGSKIQSAKNFHKYHKRDLRRIMEKRHGLDQLSQDTDIHKILQLETDPPQFPEFLEQDEYQKPSIDKILNTTIKSERKIKRDRPKFLDAIHEDSHRIFDLRRRPDGKITDKIQTYGKRNTRRPRSSYLHTLYLANKSGGFESEATNKLPRVIPAEEVARRFPSSDKRSYRDKVMQIQMEEQNLKAMGPEMSPEDAEYYNRLSKDSIRNHKEN